MLRWPPPRHYGEERRREPRHRVGSATKVALAVFVILTVAALEGGHL